MEKTLIHTGFLNKPYKVYEQDEIHYFFWQVELGIGKFKIGKLKIPTFPIKYLDYEPIKATYYKDNLVINSRFHYHIITHFNKPKLVKNKPVVDFSFGSHSPIVVTDISANTDHGYNKHFPAMVDSREIDAFTMLLCIFNSIMKGKLSFKSDRVGTYDVSSGKVPDDRIFEPREMLAIIWLGQYPDRDELEAIGYNLSKSK